MPKINVYLPDALAEAVKEAELPVSAICQAALERAVRDVTSARGTDQPPATDHPGLGLLGRFTPRARKSLVYAEQHARDAHHDHVGTEHVLLGVIDEGENMALQVLAALDIEVADLRAELVGSMPKSAHPSPEGHIPFAPQSKKALELTAKEALALGHNYIGCEHLLLGLLATEDGTASQVLRRMGVELRTTRRAVAATLAGAVHARRTFAAGDREGDDATMQEILRRLDQIERRLEQRNNERG